MPGRLWRPERLQAGMRPNETIINKNVRCKYPSPASFDLMFAPALVLKILVLNHWPSASNLKPVIASCTNFGVISVISTEDDCSYESKKGFFFLKEQVAYGGFVCLLRSGTPAPLSWNAPVWTRAGIHGFGASGLHIVIHHQLTWQCSGWRLSHDRRLQKIPQQEIRCWFYVQLHVPWHVLLRSFCPPAMAVGPPCMV